MAAGLRLVQPAGGQRRIELGELVNRGGAGGSIHTVRGDPSLAVKLYHEPPGRPELREKLTAMQLRPPELPPRRMEGRSYIQIAWPVGTVEDARGRVRGFAMPIVDLSRAVPLELLLKERTRRKHGLPASYAFRVVAAYNLATLVAELHRLGHHVIDLKPINVHVYTDTMMIAMLDCDGYSIAGRVGRRFPGHQVTSEYLAPEAIRRRTPAEKLGRSQDEFALAAILFQLLNNGLHPFQGVPIEARDVPSTLFERIGEGMYAYGRRASRDQRPAPTTVHPFLERETRAMFDRAFLRTRARPGALAWKRHLAVLADRSSGRLRPCSTDATHVHFGPGCGWCALAAGGARQPGGSGHRTLARGGTERIRDATKGAARAIRAVRRGTRTLAGFTLGAPGPRVRRAIWLFAAVFGGVLGWQASPWVR